MRVFKGIIPANIVQDLSSAAALLECQTKPCPTGKKPQGNTTYHFGPWRRSSSTTFVSQDSRTAPAKAFLAACSTVSGIGNFLLRCYYGAAAERMEALPLLARASGAWPCLGFNTQAPLGKHVDRNDPGWAPGFLVVFGAFQGGRLRFNDLYVDLHLVPGDAVLAPFGDLTHEVVGTDEELAGRKSLVSFADVLNYTATYDKPDERS
jgi:hypothetical protein